MEHTNSHFKILAECANGYLGVCECCREYNFAYKTFLLTFQEDQMHRFFDWVITNRYSPHHSAKELDGTFMYQFNASAVVAVGAKTSAIPNASANNDLYLQHEKSSDGKQGMIKAFYKGKPAAKITSVAAMHSDSKIKTEVTT